jgi:hypothetical protein
MRGRCTYSETGVPEGVPVCPNVPNCNGSHFRTLFHETVLLAPDLWQVLPRVDPPMRILAETRPRWSWEA